MVRRFEWRFLPRIDSTQHYLKALYAQGQLHRPTLVWAQEQTSGYGRKGTVWLAPPGRTLPFSFFERPSETTTLWTARIALALYDTAASWSHAPLVLKWPNDLYAPTGKLAGFLVETQWQGSTLQAAFVGIGLNVYQASYPEGLWATSLEAIGCAPPSFSAVLEAFETHLLAWEKASPTSVQTTFTNRLWKEGPFRFQGNYLEGTIEVWYPDGRLLLRTGDQALTADGHLVEMVWPPPAWPWI